MVKKGGQREESQPRNVNKFIQDQERYLKKKNANAERSRHLRDAKTEKELMK